MKIGLPGTGGRCGLGAVTSVSRPGFRRARETLDAWVREVVAWHFDPATGTPFWLDFAKRAGWDPREGGEGLRRPRPVRELPGRVAPRRAGPEVGAARLRRPAGLHLRDRRLHRRAQGPHQHRRLPHRLRAVQRHPARRVLPEGRRLAAARADGSPAAAPGRRAPVPVPRRHLLPGRPRPALGDQARQGRRDPGDGAVQAARDRPGPDAAEGPREHPVPVRDARSCSRRCARRPRSRSWGSPGSSAAAPR